MRTDVSLVLAVLAGFAGSALQTARTARADRNVIRARVYEIRASDGSLLGSLGQDEQGHVSLKLRSREKDQAITIGLDSEDEPFISMRGPDGKLRFGVQLTSLGQPALFLSDADTEARIVLGPILTDSPSPADDTWGLSIRERGTGEPRAGLLVGRVAGDKRARGILSLRGAEQHLSLLPSGEQVR